MMHFLYTSAKMGEQAPSWRSKSVISTQSQHLNARENFVQLRLASYMHLIIGNQVDLSRSDCLHLILGVIWHKYVMLGVS